MRTYKIIVVVMGAAIISTGSVLQRKHINIVSGNGFSNILNSSLRDGDVTKKNNGNDNPTSNSMPQDQTVVATISDSVTVTKAELENQTIVSKLEEKYFNKEHKSNEVVLNELIKNKLFVLQYAKRFKISVTDEEVENHIKKIRSLVGTGSKTFDQYLIDIYTEFNTNAETYWSSPVVKQQYREMITRASIINKLLESGEIKTVDTDYENLKRNIFRNWENQIIIKDEELKSK